MFRRTTAKSDIFENYKAKGDILYQFANKSVKSFLISNIFWVIEIQLFNSMMQTNDLCKMKMVLMLS
jgi:hypothetical protein